MNGDSRVRVTSGPRASCLRVETGELLVGHVHLSMRLLEAFSVPTSRGGRGGETRLRGDAVTFSPLAAPPGSRGYSIRGIGGFPVSPKKVEAVQFSYLSEEGKKTSLGGRGLGVPSIENWGGEVKVIVKVKLIVKVKVWRKGKEIAYVGVPSYLSARST
jgi:hypothetical protein